MADVAELNATAIGDIDKILEQDKSRLAKVLGLDIPSGGYASASCMFDGNGDYLSFTPAAGGNLKTCTFSTWVKRGKLGAYQNLINTELDVTYYGPALKFYNDDTLYFLDGNAGIALQSSAKYRDPSAWYHVVVAMDTTQATEADRVKIYVNNEQITSFATSTYPSQNSEWLLCSNNAHYIGKDYDASNYLDGYLTETYLIDGQALTPSSFGEADATTGQWVPKAFSGSYGARDRYYNFSDSADMGADSSGNNLDATLNGSLGASSQAVDTPTDNYCIMNWLKKATNVTPSAGALTTACGPTSKILGSIGVSSGKWYWESTFDSATAGSNLGVPTGIAQDKTDVEGSPGNDSEDYIYMALGEKRNNSSSVSYGSSFTTGDVIGVALDLDNGAIWFSKNGTWQNSATIAEIEAGTTTNAAYTGLSGTYFPMCGCYSGSATHTYTHEFGQFGLTYTVPTGFLALAAANLSDPTIKDPSDYFDISLYTGTGASLEISDFSFQPDFVWIKNRDQTDSHAMYDDVRGAQARIESDDSAAEATIDNGLTSFDADGFTLGTLAAVNTSTEDYIAWCWLESVTAGFDIVSYAGSGVAKTVSHSLGVVPEMIIVKNRDSAVNWAVYHKDLDTSAPEDKYMVLNSTASVADLNTYWNDTAPTSSVFSVGTVDNTNKSGDDLIAYLFASVEGFCKVGKYTGNASTDGPFAYCGFRPKFVMLKRYEASTTNWHIYDTSRDTYNTAQYILAPNSNLADQGSWALDIVSNGFKLRATSVTVNASSGGYIFLAFAEYPFKYANAR